MFLSVVGGGGMEHFECSLTSLHRAALVDHSDDALIAVDTQSRILSWNRGAELMFGYSSQEVLGQPLCDLTVPPNEQQHLLETLQQMNSDLPIRFTSTRHRKDGSVLQVDILLQRVWLSPNQSFVAVRKKDVTAMRRLEIEYAAEGKFRGLLDAAPDAMIIVGNDGLIQLVNRQVEVLFGYTRHELIGKPVETLVPPRFRQLHPDFRTAYFAEPQPRPMAAGLNLHGLRKDGSEFPAEISLAPMYTPEEVLVTAAIRDITERKKADERFRGLLESAPDAMVILDTEGRIALVNAQTEALFGYSRHEIVGQPIEILIPERFREEHPTRRDGYFHAPQPRPMGMGLELFGRRKDGSEFAAEISLSPIHTAEGTLATAAIRDVTDRKRDMEEQNRRMQEANRLKSEFLASMSHELRTPLNAVIGFAALIHCGKAGPLSDIQKEYLGDILTSSRHLLQLINDVLDLAKIESGRTELNLESVDLQKISGEVRDVLRGLAANKRVRVTLSADPELDLVTLDPRLFKQILYNYLSNAIKFTPEQGVVTIDIAAIDANYFRLDVKDNGIGINPEEIGRLFIEFQQLDSGAAKKYPGTGLGLALTKRIVEAQGGTVSVRSTPGEGSVFSAILPRVVQPSAVKLPT